MLKQMHSNKYLFKCVLIHASNIKISLSPLSLLSFVIKTMRGSRGQKNDTGCRWQRREHNPPFRRSSEHSAARRAASSGRLHSPHSRPPVSRRRGSGVGQGLRVGRPPGFNGRENVRTADTVLDDCHPFALRIKGVRGCPQRFRSSLFSSLPACFGWWSGFKPVYCREVVLDEYGTNMGTRSRSIACSLRWFVCLFVCLGKTRKSILHSLCLEGSNNPWECLHTESGLYACMQALWCIES